VTLAIPTNEDRSRVLTRVLVHAQAVLRLQEGRVQATGCWTEAPSKCASLVGCGLSGGRC
jgi:hypothetical protein